MTTSHWANCPRGFVSILPRAPRCRPGWIQHAFRPASGGSGAMGPEIIMTLFCYGLPSCYAAAKGVQVLALTTRLFSNPTRRVIETAQMVVDVMAPGGLAARGRGIRTAQKVRLMHAAVRY